MSNPIASIIIPSRDRPVGLLRAIVSTLATTRPGQVEIVVVRDPPDNTTRDLLGTLRRFPVIRSVLMPHRYVDGHPQLKYQTGYEAARGEWTISGADDIAFHPGWLDALLAHPNEGFVGLFDPHHKLTLATLVAVTRDYTEKVMGGLFGLPYYRVWAADREYRERAKQAGAWTVCEGAGFDHFHPALKTAPSDRISQMSSQWHAQDAKTFEERAARGFPKDWPWV